MKQKFHIDEEKDGW